MHLYQVSVHFEVVIQNKSQVQSVCLIAVEICDKGVYISYGCCTIDQVNCQNGQNQAFGLSLYKRNYDDCEIMIFDNAWSVSASSRF